MRSRSPKKEIASSATMRIGCFSSSSDDMRARTSSIKALRSNSVGFSSSWLESRRFTSRRSPTSRTSRSICREVTRNERAAGGSPLAFDSWGRRRSGWGLVLPDTRAERPQRCFEREEVLGSGVDDEDAGNRRLFCFGGVHLHLGCIHLESSETRVSAGTGLAAKSEQPASRQRSRSPASDLA